MKTINAIKKYLETDKRIFLQPTEGTGVYVVRKDKKPYFGLNGKITSSEVHHIDEQENPDSVTIYIKD